MSGILLAGASVIGPGHVTEGTPNQDAYLTRRLEAGFLLVVCDGMGSKSLSHIGSSMACRAVLDITTSVDYSIADRDLIESIYKRWLQLMEGTDTRNAITTCLFCWGDKSGQVRSFQLGDGLILANGLAVVEAGENFSNETTGLGLSKKYSDWAVRRFQLDRGEAVALMTDGISEDIESGVEQQLLGSMRDSFKGMSARRVKKALIKELSEWPTPNHLDDKTLAIAIR